MLKELEEFCSENKILMVQSTFGDWNVDDIAYGLDMHGGDVRAHISTTLDNLPEGLEQYCDISPVVAFVQWSAYLNHLFMILHSVGLKVNVERPYLVDSDKYLESMMSIYGLSIDDAVSIVNKLLDSEKTMFISNIVEYQNRLVKRIYGDTMPNLVKGEPTCESVEERAKSIVCQELGLVGDIAEKVITDIVNSIPTATRSQYPEDKYAAFIAYKQISESSN